MRNRVWLVVACLQLASLTASAGTDLKFKIPDGWVDLSPGAPAENFSKVPAAVAQSARDPAVVAFAMDIDHPQDGFAMNFNARDVGPVPPIDEAAVKTLADTIGAQASKELPGCEYRVLSHRTAPIQGVTCGRFESELVMKGLTIRQLAYLLTDGKRGVVVTYSASPKQFEANLGVLDSAAQATRGIKAMPSRFGNILQGAGWGALRGALIGMLVAAGIAIGRRKAT